MFQLVLHSAASRLALPAQVGAAVVGGDETDAGHAGDCVGMPPFWQEASKGDSDGLEWMTGVPSAP
ncbi:hypothetical protein [Akkermansia sp.]|uniref:hypothetical protein n=1 Tax=Akkermansia sp. TaxID=1872421 RepID=UPI003994C699